MFPLNKFFDLSGFHKHGRKITVIFVLFTIFSFSQPANAKYGGGSGTADDPYQIASAPDLIALGESPEDYDKHFILIDNIDLDPNLPGCKVFDKAVIGAENIYDDPESFGGTPFSGRFDGQGYVIHNLNIQGSRYLGLFGLLDSGAVIANLGLEAVDVNGTGYNIGGLVGYNWGGNIATCYSTGAVNGGASVGGLIGENIYGSICSSYSTGIVRSRLFDVGGLVGWNSGSISSSFSTSAVNGSSFDVGGLVGSNYGSISSSYSKGTVIGERHVGGLVGENGDINSFIANFVTTGTITASYSTSTVIGDRSVGGLVGYNNGGSITTSCNTGAVSGIGEVGGLVGDNIYGSISSSYSIGAVSGISYIGGLVGLNLKDEITYISSSFWDIQTSGLQTSDGGIGLTTTQMKDIQTFLDAGWDLVDETANGTCDFWQFQEGAYPSLAVFSGVIPVEPNGEGTQETPYLITDAKELGSVWYRPMAHYRLAADIDLSGITWGIALVPWFGGSFDGNDFCIRSLHIQGGSCLGLFGTLGRNPEVTNLGLEDISVAGTGDDIGGLVANNYGHILSSYSIGIVTGDSWIGGLVGNNLGRISSSYSASTVSGYNCIGGLGGYNRGSILSSYSTGAISGNATIGGLVGYNVRGGFIRSSYSTGAVSGNNGIGGLVGVNRTFDYCVSSCFWDIETSGQTTSDGGIGKTTAEMKMASTFIGWGCDPVWTIDEGVDYPRLVWENCPGELITKPSYGGGSGTQAEPYLIYTAEQLNLVGLILCDLDKHFRLMADIDLSEFTGMSFNIIGNYGVPFTGTFDGNGHTITNFSYTCADAGYIGLFGYVGNYSGEDGVIKDLGLIAPYVDAGTGGCVGSLVGYLDNSGTITGCYAKRASVSGGFNVGGLVGSGETLINCYATGKVSGDSRVGGLAGIGTVLTSCYATCSVSGNESVGGLVGYNSWNGNITASFWDVETSGHTNSVGGIGKTTAEMQTASTFLEAGWDFVGETENGIEDIWWILEGQDYPHLWWELAEEQ
jgi:hypothetical protein